jgi:hypothetical protein
MNNIKQAETIPELKLWGNSRGNCMKAKGHYQDFVHSDQMVLMMAGQGSWTA